MLPTALALLFCYLLAAPLEALASTRAGLVLWYRSVLPVLFPFMLVSGLFLQSGALHRLPSALTRPLRFLFRVSAPGAFAVLTGFLCGFPMGAKITSDLRKKQLIGEAEALRLTGFANNVSPAFLLSYVAAEQLGCPQYRFFLLADVLGAAALWGVLTIPRGGHSFSNASASPDGHSFSEGPASRDGHSFSDGSASRDGHSSTGASAFPDAYNLSDGCIPSDDCASRDGHSSSDGFASLDDCIMDAVTNTMKLGVYITMFQIISDAFLRLLPLRHPLLLFLGASVEVTGGVSLLASSGLSFPLKFVLTNALCAFGGFCALAQTASVARLTRPRLFAYIKSRAMIALLSVLFSVVTLLFLRLVLF